MRQELIRIGNSRGIRIPKPFIAQCRLGDVVELRLTRAGLLVAPYRRPRHGWKKAFAASDLSKQRLLLKQTVRNAFDKEDWEW
jgi:antitoxin MazE